MGETNNPDLSFDVDWELFVGCGVWWSFESDVLRRIKADGSGLYEVPFHTRSALSKVMLETKKEIPKSETCVWNLTPVI